MTNLSPRTSHDTDRTVLSCLAGGVNCYGGGGGGKCLVAQTTLPLTVDYTGLARGPRHSANAGVDAKPEPWLSDQQATYSAVYRDRRD